MLFEPYVCFYIFIYFRVMERSRAITKVQIREDKVYEIGHNKVGAEVYVKPYI